MALFQLFSSLNCYATAEVGLCRGIRGGAVYGLCLLAAAGVLLAMRPDLRAGFQAIARTPAQGASRWLALHVAGVAVMVLARIVSGAAPAEQAVPILLAGLVLGGALAAVGGLFWLAPPAGLWRLLRLAPGVVGMVAAIALLIPVFANLVGSLWWTFQGLVTLTFYGVAIVLALLGNVVYVDPASVTIGTGGFAVQVADSCSGIEGLALITAFMAIQAILLRDSLRQGRFWLMLWPAALVASLLFNILRIAVLILIGVHISPDLAVNGFHSFAGWLAFTLLAMGVLAVVQLIPGLHRVSASPPPSRHRSPVARDRGIAFILPFIAFMLAGLVSHTFFAEPLLAYPLVTVAMAVVILALRAPFLALEWRVDPLAVAAGVAIAVLWALTAPPAPTDAALLGLTPLWLVLWMALRAIGTAILVPLTEEAFFRGYLFDLIDTGGLWRRAAAIVVSTAAFAALHGRPVEAAVSGVVFAALMLRKGRLADAIVAHMVANAGLALWALLQGNLALM